MPAPRQIVPLVLGNLDAGGTDPKLVADGLLLLENARFSRRGAIEKRHGFVGLTGSYDDPHLGVHQGKPVVYGDALSVFGGSSPIAGSFDAVATIDGEGERLGMVDIAVESLLAGQAGAITNAEIYVAGNIVAVCYAVDRQSSTSGLGTFDQHLVVLDRYSGVQLAAQQIRSATAAECSCRFYLNSAATKLWVLYPAGSATWSSLFVQSIDTTTGAIGAASLLVGSLSSSSTPDLATRQSTSRTYSWDLCGFGEDDDVCLVYERDSPFDLTVVSLRLASAASVNGTFDVAATGPLRVTCFAMAPGKVVVAWYDDGLADVRAITVDATPTRTNGAAAGTSITGIPASDWIQGICGLATSETQFRLYMTRQGFGGPIVEHSVDSIHVTETAYTVDTSRVTLHYHVALCAKAFKDSAGRPHVPLFYADRASGWEFGVTHPQWLLLRDHVAHGALSSGYVAPVVARTLEGTAAFSYVYRNGAARTGLIGHDETLVTPHLATPVSLGTDQWVIAARKTTQLAGVDARTNIVRLDVSLPSAALDLEAGGAMLIAGQHPVAFDGRRIVEQGFAHSPQNLTLATSGTGGGFATADYTDGSFGYLVLYEWYDAQGNRYLSAPSLLSEIAVTAATHDAVTVEIPGLTLTQKRGVQAVVYRSEAANSRIYRRRGAIDVQGSVTVTFTDTANDGVGKADRIAEQEEIYTAGRELENEPPDAHRVATIFDRRYCYVPREREDSELRYSKPLIGGVAIEHNRILSLELPPEGGRVVALAPLDDKLVIFKANQIYGTHGEGLNGQGEGVNYAAPFLVSAAVGCIEQRSVVRVPAGLMFLSDSGIYLLDRSLQLQPVGRGVKRYTDSATITAAVLLAGDDAALFVTLAGPALLYSYLFNQWCVWTGVAADDAVVADGTLYLKRAGEDAVAALNESSHADDDGAVVLKLQTGWINFGQLGSRVRVDDLLIYAHLLSATGRLRVRFGYNWAPSWSEPVIVEAADIGALVQPDDYFADGLSAADYDNVAPVLRAHLGTTKVGAVRVSIDDEPNEEEEPPAEDAEDATDTTTASALVFDSAFDEDESGAGEIDAPWYESEEHAATKCASGTSQESGNGWCIESGELRAWVNTTPADDPNSDGENHRLYPPAHIEIDSPIVVSFNFYLDAPLELLGVDEWISLLTVDEEDWDSTEAFSILPDGTTYLWLNGEDWEADHSETAVSTGEWHRLTAYIEINPGGNSHYSYWIDGVKLTKAVQSSDPGGSSIIRMHAGLYTSSGVDYARYQMRDIRIWTLDEPNATARDAAIDAGAEPVTLAEPVVSSPEQPLVINALAFSVRAMQGQNWVPAARAATGS